MSDELTLFIYDSSGNLILDPHGEINDVDIESYRTAWPGGFVDAKMSISRPITRSWAVVATCRAVIKDGLQTVFEGSIEDLPEQMSGGSERVDLMALGFHARLRSRLVHKRWCDVRLSEWRWPSTPPAAQDKFTIDHQDRIQFMAKDGVTVNNAEYVAEAYTMPTGETISRITFDYDLQEAGQNWRLGLYDPTGAAYLWSVVVSGAGSVNHSPVTPRQTLEFRFDNNSGGGQVGVEDGSIYGKITNLNVFSETGNIYAEEVIQDLLALVSEISTDYGDIGAAALALEPFITNGWKPMADVIRSAASYGDASQNTWGFCIWDSEKSSDGLPQGKFEARSTSDYEYEVALTDCEEFSSNPSLDQLHNWIVAEYRNEKGERAWLTPDDDANLKDTTSIAAYGQRDHVLRVDTESTTTATNLARRYLARHKDPVYKVRIVVAEQIKDKRGVLQPACRVRAGERLKVSDYLGGTTYFIAFTEYNAQTGLLTISPDTPPDDVAILLAQLQLGR